VVPDRSAGRVVLGEWHSTLLVPLVRVLARAPWRTLAVLVLGLALVSAWYGAFVLTVWRYSP
jgi:hypothetical protein